VVTALCALVLCAAPPPAPPPRRIFGWAPFADPKLEANQRRDGSIAVVQWIGKEDKPYRLLWPGGRVTCMAMSFDGKYLAAGMDGRVIVWSVRDGKELFRAKMKKPTSLMFNSESGELHIRGTLKLPGLFTTEEEDLEALDNALQTWSLKAGKRVEK
jgi:hypothetical protein